MCMVRAFCCRRRDGSRSSRMLAAGCDGREGLQRGQARVDEETFADGQAVWSRHPDAGVNPRVTSPGGWWLTSPVHQGERGAAVKTIAQGMSVVSAEPVVTAACVSCCRRAMGEASTRHSLRPSEFRGAMSMHNSGKIVPRECSLMSSPLSCPGLTGASSKPRLLGSISDVSGILDRPVEPGDDVAIRSRDRRVGKAQRAHQFEQSLWRDGGLASACARLSYGGRSRSAHPTQRHTFSSACTRSPIRSSACSRPVEKRMKPSLMPSSARASGLRR